MMSRSDARILKLGEPMQRRILCLLLTLALLGAMVIPAAATGLSNARAIGMAGAYTSLARGYDCPFFNPANLGITARQLTGVQLIGVGVSVSNNSFSLDDYNSYTGATLSQQDKDNLLDKIPVEGLKVSADAEASVLAFGMGNLAFSVSGIGAAEINISREVAELLMDGNTIADTIALDGTYGEGFGIGSFNVSYGHCLYKFGDRQLAVGGTYRYLRGFGYEEITHMNGEAVTLMTGFEGVGSVISRTATGGNGHALDLGATLQISKRYTVGATVFNFLSRMNWNRDTEEHRYSFDFDTLNVGNMSNGDIITSSDTTVEIDDFTTGLPSTIRLGLAKTSGSLLWAVDWEQGFKQAAGSSSKPRFSAGGEYRLLGFLPMRVGFGVGGKQGTTYAAGLGIDLTVVNLDVAVANYNAISGSSGKGLNFAINLAIGL